MSKKSQSEARSIAQALLSENIVFLDTETTGLGADDEIIEISIIGKRGEILLDTLIKPVKSIPASSSKIHNITNWQVRNSPTWPEIYQNYRDVVKNKTVIIYNRKFDNRILRQTCGKYRLTTPRIKTICLMELYSLYEGVINRRTGEYKWFKLIDAIEGNNIATSGGFHRALGDVSASRKLLYFIAGKDECFAINKSDNKLISHIPTHYSECEYENDSDFLLSEKQDFKSKHKKHSSFDDYIETVSPDKTDKDNPEDKIRLSSIYLGLFLFIMFSITLVFIINKSF